MNMIDLLVRDHDIDGGIADRLFYTAPPRSRRDRCLQLHFRKGAAGA
jgi:hypothetical protein